MQSKTENVNGAKTGATPECTCGCVEDDITCEAWDARKLTKAGVIHWMIDCVITFLLLAGGLSLVYGSQFLAAQSLQIGTVSAGVLMVVKAHQIAMLAIKPLNNYQVSVVNKFGEEIIIG